VTPYTGIYDTSDLYWYLRYWSPVVEIEDNNEWSLFKPWNPSSMGGRNNMSSSHQSTASSSMLGNGVFCRRHRTCNRLLATSQCEVLVFLRSRDTPGTAIIITTNKTCYELNSKTPPPPTTIVASPRWSQFAPLYQMYRIN
jgi:hypothetical protein